MMSTPACWLLIALSTVGQEPAVEPDEWKRYTDAANAALEAGDFAKAEALLVQVVHEAQKLEPDDLRQAPPLERLAQLYATDGRNRFAEAEPLLREALAIRYKVQGAEHPDLVRPLFMLGLCAAKSKKQPPDAAEGFFERALAIAERADGKNDPEVAKVLHGMAVTQLARKDFSAGERNLTRAIAIRTMALGPNNTTLGDLLDDLGDVHALQVRPFDSEREAARAEHRELNETASERHGRLAHECYTRALAIRERTLEPTDPDIGESMFNLAQLGMIRDRYAEGDVYLERWLAFQKRVDAPASEELANALRMWAQFPIERCDWAEAQRRLEQAQPTIEQVEGAKSDGVCEFLAKRADVALEAKQFDEAERFLKRGLEIQAALCGPGDANIKEARRLMAGRFQDHARDPRGFLLWNDVSALADDPIGESPENPALSTILIAYGTLLRRTNKAVPRPSDEDMAFVGGRIGENIGNETRVEFLSWDMGGLEFHDATLIHAARFYGARNL